MTTHDTEAIRAQMEALAGFTAGPWYTHNQPGNWGLGGAHSIHVADASPYDWDQCIAHVEYQTPYCLGEKPSVIDASRTAARNARLIAAAPDMRETILALCGALDEMRAELSALRARGAEMRAALTEIANITERKKSCFPDDWREQIAACAECQRYKHHPIQQGICDDHRKPIYSQQDHDAHETKILGYRAQSIARAALAQKGAEP